jgi:hypothetical protein
MSCPYFKEGYFGVCDAPNAIHVPTIAEMEAFCIKVYYESCPTLRILSTLETRWGLALCLSIRRYA